jgi:hypothetical protein
MKRFIEGADRHQVTLLPECLDVVAIDGSKFKAVNSRDRNFLPGKIDARKEQIEQSMDKVQRVLA